MPHMVNQHSPYKTADEAAAYIRKGLSTFRGYVRKYKIPRHGPAKDRYRIDELDAFMADCTCFLETIAPMKIGRRSFTPVQL